jgi:hypothetical protein
MRTSIHFRLGELEMLISLIRFFSHASSLGNIPGGMDLRHQSKCLNQSSSTGSRSLPTISRLPRPLQDLVSISAISALHPRSCRREAGGSPLRRAATPSRLSDSEVHPGAIHKRTRIPLKEKCSLRFTTTNSHTVSSISHLTSPLTSCCLIHGCFSARAELGYTREVCPDLRMASCSRVPRRLALICTRVVP